MKTCAIILLFFVSGLLRGQNETRIWYFGNGAGLDFVSSPPTILTNGALTTIEGCATICDAGGNLLFYTDGIKVFDKNHTIMQNGSGLTGNSSSSQSAIIAKKPGSSHLYYIFSNSGPFGQGAAYSVVDMSLAAGMGSVTTKNVMLSDSMTEKLTSAKHCNGTDVWIITHQFYTDKFKVWQLSSTGVSALPVISQVGSAHLSSFPGNYAGCMKTSPNGKKLGVALYGQGSFEMFDFDNTTGVVSNSLNLHPTAIQGAYGCEFSPDGTKFYGSTGTAPGNLFQWDLCAGIDSAVVASRVTVYTSTAGIAAMQNAKDGRIYAARFNQNVLGVIGSPNAKGTACNYTDLGQSIAPKSTVWSIPNFLTGFAQAPSPPFTFTAGCSSATFAAAPALDSLCAAVSYTLTGYSWNFGDPASGAANTSTLSKPQHSFSAPGTYTVRQILQYSCGAPDTVSKVIQILGTAPSLSVAGVFTVCSGEKRVFTASGANTYSWSTGAQTASISVSYGAVAVTTVVTYTISGTNTLSGCASSKTLSVTINKCTGVAATSPGGPAISVYPNPAGDRVFAEASAPGSFAITDLRSSVLLEGELLEGRQTLDLSALPPGIYVLKATLGESPVVLRLVRQE